MQIQSSSTARTMKRDGARGENRSPLFAASFVASFVGNVFDKVSKSSRQAILGATALLLLGGCGRDGEKKPEAAPAPKPAVEAPAPAVVEKPVLSAAAERMADPAYLKEMQDIGSRRGAVSEQANALAKRMEERLVALEAESEPVREATAKLETLRKALAEAETAIAEQEKALKALVEEDAVWRSLSSELDTLAAARDALSKEMQAVVQKRMLEQAEKQPAPQLPRAKQDH